MSIAKMVSEMISKGVCPDVIELAVSTAEEALRSANSTGIPVDSTTEKRRAYDRDRKRKDAEIRRNSTGNPPNAESALTILDNISVSKPEKKERAQRNRGELLPPESKPAAEHYAMAAERGFLANWVEHQFEDMRIWARTNEHRAVARKSDWNLTFTGWLRRSMNDAKGTINGTRNINTQRRSASSDFFAGVSSVAADLIGDREPPRSSAPEVPRGRIEIDG